METRKMVVRIIASVCVGGIFVAKVGEEGSVEEGLVKRVSISCQSGDQALQSL